MIKMDSGWVKVSEVPNKGITHYERKVVFAWEPEHNDFIQFYMRFERESPGNFPITCVQTSENHYTFKSVLDSSD